MELFKRRAILTIDRLRIDSADGLDFRFDVSANTEREPNTAEIRIWNLSEERRGTIEGKRNAVVVLEVGYEGFDELHELFRGEVDVARSRRDGSDFLTTIQAGDGERAFRGARASTSLRRNATVKDAARQLADQIKVEAGNMLDQLGKGKIGLTDKFESGTVLDGSASDELDRLARSAGLDWSIQGGAIQMAPRGQGVPGDPVLLTSDFGGNVEIDDDGLPVTRAEGANTGLIGSPSIDTDGNVQATALIIPELTPGRRVKVQSSSVEALGYIREASYAGSSFEQQWHVDMNIKPERNDG